MQFALRPITNKSVHTRLGSGCFDVLLTLLLVSVARLYRWQNETRSNTRNTRNTDGKFFSTVNAALKKNFAGISSFAPQ